MTTRRDLRLLAALALLIAACTDDPTTPDAAATLRLCSDADFVAYQDERGRWTPLRGADGEYAFRAPPRLGLAFAWPEGPLPYLVVEYMTAAEAAAMHACAPPALPRGEPTVPGVVAGRDGDVRQVEVSHGATRVYVTGAESTFRLHPTTEPHDLVATRAGPWTDAGTASDAIILRRDVALSTDSRVTLDFRAGEAFAPEPRTARFTGVRGDGAVFFLARGSREVFLAGGQWGEPGGAAGARTLPLAAVPASRTLPGDLHHLLLADGGRDLHLWRRDIIGDLELRLGDPAATPTFTPAGTSPYLRLDATVPSQADYDGSVWLYYDQAHPINSSVSMRVTRGYQGDLSGGWRVPMPDMTGVQGFPTVSGLKPGRVRWTLRVANRQGEMFRWVPTPVDGDEWREATASGLLF